MQTAHGRFDPGAGDRTESLRRLSGDFGLPDGADGGLARLLDALAREPHAPTALRGWEEALELHVRDSLLALDPGGIREAGSVADLGSGAGFPGVPLALAAPGARFDLVESSRRKCEVIRRLITAAGARNARAVPARAEEWAGGEGRGAYDVVTARALASLPVLVEYAAPLLAEGGRLVAWKAARDQDEERAGDESARAVGLSPGSVVEIPPTPRARDRHLHVYRKVEPTPERFPRRPGMARKRPLA